MNVARIKEALSSSYYKFVYLNQLDCPKDVLSALNKELPHITAESWHSRIEWGGLFLNGRAVTENIDLKAPCRIEYYEPKYDFINPDSKFPKFKSDYVLFNDGELCLIFKPAGIPCFQAREQKKIYLKAEVEKVLGTTIHMPSRLDTGVSGLMAVSAKPRFHDQLQRLYEKRLIQKHYLFLTVGKPKWDAITVNAAIGDDPTHAVLRKVVETDGKEAITQLKVLGTGEHTLSSGKKVDVTLIKAKPVTGRTHQIRIHAAHVGFPIIGDSFYGGEESDSLHLVSFCLRFKRPITGEPIDFKLPRNFLPDWAKKFMEFNDHVAHTL